MPSFSQISWPQLLAPGTLSQTMTLKIIKSKQISPKLFYFRGLLPNFSSRKRNFSWYVCILHKMSPEGILCCFHGVIAKNWRQCHDIWTNPKVYIAKLLGIMEMFLLCQENYLDSTHVLHKCNETYITRRQNTLIVIVFCFWMKNWKQMNINAIWKLRQANIITLNNLLHYWHLEHYCWKHMYFFSLFSI